MRPISVCNTAFRVFSSRCNSNLNSCLKVDSSIEPLCFNCDNCSRQWLSYHFL